MTTTINKALSIIKVSDSLSLITEVLDTNAKKKEVSIATDNIMIVDCSGSMYDELPNMRKHIKNKVSSFLGENDTLTLIGFSGTGESTVIFESVAIQTLKDLSKIHQTVDKYLQPTGLTNFKEPLILVKDVISRLRDIRKDSAISLFFLTDGYHNSGGSKEDVLNIAKKLSSHVSSFTACGYGNYYDDNLLNKIAESVGGQMISSERFEDYEPLIEQTLTKRLGSSKKKEITFPHKVKNNIVVSISPDNDITVFTVDENNTALVPEDLESVIYLTDDKLTNVDDSLTNYIRKVSKDITGNQKDLQNIYGMISVLAQRMKSSEVYSILECLGDKEVSFGYCNAFGKQNLSAFNNSLLLKVKLQDSMFKEGYDLFAIPPSNAYSVLNLFEDLMDDNEAKWYPKHESFVYNRIGSKRVQRNTNLTDDEKLQLKDLSEKLSTETKVENIKKINEEIMKLTNNKVELIFEPKNVDKGYPISSLTWNEDRPNISIRATYEGSVKLPENSYGIDSVDSFKFNNYAIIKDGIVNVDVLPISVSENTFKKLKIENIIDKNESWSPDKIFLINLRNKLNGETFPVINRDMVKSVSAKDVFENVWELTKLRASQKVFGHYEKLMFPKESKGFKDKYGEEATKWLTELGITDFNGFNPKTDSELSGESYMAKELTVSVASYSSLPSINALEKKLGSGKSLTPSESLLNDYYQEYQSFIDSDIYKKASNQTNLLETWLKDKKKDSTTKTRQLLTYLSKIKFSIILGQVWFSEFDSIENSTMEITTPDGKTLTFTANLKDVEEKI